MPCAAPISGTPRLGLAQPPPFVVGENGLKPATKSPQYYASVFMAMAEEKADYMDKHMAALGGRKLAIDHSFKAAKLIRLGNGGGRACGAVLTVMNEYCQPTAQFLTATKSLSEVAPALATMAANRGQLSQGVRNNGGLCLHAYTRLSSMCA